MLEFYPKVPKVPKASQFESWLRTGSLHDKVIAIRILVSLKVLANLARSMRLRIQRLPYSDHHTLSYLKEPRHCSPHKGVGVRDFSDATWQRIPKTAELRSCFGPVYNMLTRTRRLKTSGVFHDHRFVFKRPSHVRIVHVNKLVNLVCRPTTVLQITNASLIFYDATFTTDLEIILILQTPDDNELCTTAANLPARRRKRFASIGAGLGSLNPTLSLALLTSPTG
jgi:hypothetical protein